MRIAVVMPFVGYLILLNAKLAELFKIRAEFNIFSDSAPWNLIYVYFASFFTGAGSLTYGLSCPTVLKRYADFSEYRNEERELWRSPEFRKKKSEEIRIEVIKNVHDMGNPGVLSSRNHRSFTDIEALGADPDKIDEYLFQEWELKDRNRPFARIACAAFYIIGLALFVVPSMRTFVKVAQVSINAL